MERCHSCRTISHISPCKQEMLFCSFFSTARIYSPVEEITFWGPLHLDWRKRRWNKENNFVCMASDLACFFIYLLIPALHFHSLFFLFHVFLLTLPDHFGSSPFLLDFHVKFHSLNTNTSNHGFLVVLILLEKQAGAAACSSGFQLPFALLEQDVGEEEKNQQQLKVLWSQQTTEVMLQ